MSKSIKPLWFNALNSFTCDSTKSLSENEYYKRADKVEIYTGNLEHKLNLPNIWGEGHANYLKCKNAFFGSLFGDFSEFNRFKSIRQQRDFDEQQRQFDKQLNEAEFE